MSDNNNFSACANLKDDCCGCEVCIQVCPKGVFSPVRDCIGFLYPKADASKCVSCGLCARKCPVLNAEKIAAASHNIEVYAGWHTDKKTLAESSSGGFFSALSQAIFDIGGKVAGAVYSEDFRAVEFFLADSYPQTAEMRGSKYVQGRKADIYAKIKSALATSPVLFCATPCEVAALISYLGKNPDNLYTCDFLCHGPTTTLALAQMVDFLQEKYSAKISELTMRYKRFGWFKKHIFRCKFSNGKAFEKFFGNMPLGKAFSVLKRKSCHSCKFKGDNRAADLTMADYWNIVDNLEGIEYNKDGTSLVIVNTPKGAEIFSRIKNFESIDTLDFFKRHIPHALVHCAPISTARKTLEADFAAKGLVKAVEASKSPKSKLMEFVPVPVKYYTLKLAAAAKKLLRK